MNKNSLKFDGEIELKIDVSCNIQIGDIIEIDKLLLRGKYIVTKIMLIVQTNEQEWIITCKNANMLNNFIDVFRGENPQTEEDRTYKTSIVHYVEEEIKEEFEVIK